ncbi:MAG: ribosome maturation factor RimM, partial [Alphaproteobacteria bacterium]|nr:ribosome maturation factor RimM [Alphaproteobacteria bacterium]
MAVIGAPHGVHGRMRVKTFTEDRMAIGGYGALEDEAAERRFELRVTGETK